MEAGRIDKNENYGKIEIQKNGVRAEETAQTGKESKSMKCTCECGSTYCRNNKINHERTKKHIDYISLK